MSAVNLPPIGPLPLVLRADARDLPLADSSVDLCVTSPPYFGLRSYTDGGKHYEQQIGAEATPAEFVDALIAVTRECMRVLKPSGSLWVNLGDKYAGGGGGNYGGDAKRNSKGGDANPTNVYNKPAWLAAAGMRPKSLIGVPWRYALRCIDDLGLILRAEVIWSKPNGLPESVTDRVRRSHEAWFHFTQEPRYYSSVDEVREEHARLDPPRPLGTRNATQRHIDATDNTGWKDHAVAHNLLGKLPGSVWTVPTEPLRVPEHLGVQHFAAFPSEFPRRIISGWSPRGVCVECGEGRRPVVEREPMQWRPGPKAGGYELDGQSRKVVSGTMLAPSSTTITGYACACAEPTAPTTPAVVLDPFGGTGTTAHVAHALGRQGISVDLSADYCRIARDSDVRGQRVAKVRGFKRERRVETEGQADLFGEGVA